MRHGGRRRRGGLLEDLPWVTIAVIVGVIAVAGIALVFFMGGGSAPTASSGSSGSSGVSPATTQLSNSGVASITVRTTAAVTVPSKGTNVQVSYLGSFAGSYGPDGALIKIQDSGSRLYPVENANGTIRAKFQKQDSSTKQVLTVQIWKDGKAVKYATNSSAYGIVSIQYP